jgi:gliding motility-associated-like protein
MLLLALLAHREPALGQSATCSGNLGENIFTAGDFGSGFVNILPDDPRIAPGYAYTRQAPPNDGFYTITNDMRKWASAFDWVRVKDNSQDPNGYMMVVNASFQPGLFYEQKVDGLCENSRFEFSVDVFNLIPAGKNKIKPNVSFLIDGKEALTTGNVPENERWNTYGFVFTTAPGQTSVTLALRNNAPGGNGNDLALDNISFRACGPKSFILPTEIANICEDGSPIALKATVIGDEYSSPKIQWQESVDGGAQWKDIPGARDSIYTHTRLSGGYYYYRYLIANSVQNLQNSKCRIVSNIKIVHVVPKFYTIADTICQGLAYRLGNQQFTASGVYVDSLKTVIGCDSIVTLNLTVVPDPLISADLTLKGPTCDAPSGGSVTVDRILRGNPPFSLIANGRELGNVQRIDGLNAGNHTIRITDRNGCSFETVAALENPLPFTVDIGQNLEVDLGETVNISALSNRPVLEYRWQYTPAIDCPNCAMLEWLPISSGMLSVYTRSDKNCIATDSLFIKVNKIRRIFIPDAFTPDGDGKNDLFTVFAGIPNVKRIEQLLVFDRWGGIVFERLDFPPNDPSLGWDGSVHGKAAPEGPYAYIARIRFLDEITEGYSGDIQLIR